MDEPTERKKKRSGKNKGPSGFEEYFAEPPLTPQEAEEEAYELYAPNIAITFRIQTCIERYQAQRRFQTDLRTYFDEYMFLGGIKTFGAPFSGRETEVAGHWNASHNKHTSSQHVSFSGRFYDGEDENWTVDFAGVAAGFLSTTLPTLTGLQPDAMEKGISVVENFLRYVLHHSVCPEYVEDVKQALQIVADARTEWPMLSKFQKSVPGQFNLAAAEIFGRRDADDWAFQNFVRPKDFDPKKVLYSALALLDDGELLAIMADGQAQGVSELECSLVLVEVIHPQDDEVQLFRRLNIGDVDNNTRLSPIGKARFKTTVIEDGWYDPHINRDLTEDGEIVLYMEASILACMKIGMKFEMKVCRVDVGMYFLKSIVKALPSFYTFLPQQLMRDFTPPQKVEPKRVTHQDDARP